MRTLVYAAGPGPGPLATFIAAKLQAAGADVTLVARGERPPLPEGAEGWEP